MKHYHLALGLLLTLIAFAANSLLCRAALQGHHADPIAFTSLRLGSGAALLGVLVLLQQRRAKTAQPRQSLLSIGTWKSAVALFAYAIGFSFAYVSISTGTGALLLFGAVQLTMIGRGLYAGERFSTPQWLGFVAALLGLGVLTAPGVSAPAPFGALLMICAGAAWGVYSLRGRGETFPLLSTAGNFIKSMPLLLPLLFVGRGSLHVDAEGYALGVVSGAVASALGYILWYAVLPKIAATLAATLQLTVPVIAALMGAVFLGETLSLRFALAALFILGGVALVILKKDKKS